MIRRASLIPVLLPFALFIGAAAGADMATPAVVRAVTLIDMGSARGSNAVVTTDGRVVFRNRSAGSTRIVLSRKDASAFDCFADGEEVVRSRGEQYVLRGGAELSCTVRPGRYRYTTLTQQQGGVRMVRSTLRVPN